MSIRDAIHSILPVPALKVISSFRENPFQRGESKNPKLSDVVTDLPIQRATYLGRGTNGHLVRTASVEGSGVDFFNTLLKVTIT